MKTFKVEINGHIAAQDIDDAFAVIGAYFTDMSENGVSAESPFLTGQHHIYPDDSADA